VEAQMAGRTLDPPSSLVDQDVMMAAEQGQVLDAGLTAFHPEVEMVGIAPMGRPIASREDTASIAGADRHPQRRRHQSLGPAHVERL
jgi:hypothetical protein